VDELSKLWTAFKADYRLSAAYWASVVLIDSKLAGQAPLPVLQRGQEDQGALVQGDVVPRFATLTGLQPPEDQLDLRPGETLTLLGHHLDSGDLTVRFRHLGLDQTVDVAPDAGGRSFDKLTVTLAPQGGWDWPAGFYSVALHVAGDDDHQTGAALGVAVAPAVEDIQPDPADLDANGGVELTVTCGPPGVRADQRAALLLGSHETRHERIDGSTSQLTFAVRGARAGTYRARLRVDGATSRFIDHGETPPKFVGRQVRLRDAAN
jgi:Pvc16 N-terminal domain